MTRTNEYDIIKKKELFIMPDTDERKIKCPACGNDLPEETKFCIYCGTKIPESVSGTAPAENGSPAPAAPVPEQPEGSVVFPGKDESASAEPSGNTKSGTWTASQEDPEDGTTDSPSPEMTPAGKLSTSKKKTGAVSAISSGVLFTGCLTACLGHLAAVVGQGFGTNGILNMPSFFPESEAADGFVNFLSGFRQFLFPLTAVSGFFGYFLAKIFPILALIFLFSAWKNAGKCAKEGRKPGGLTSLRVLALIRLITVSISGAILIAFGIVVSLVLFLSGAAISTLIPALLGFETVAAWCLTVATVLGIVFYIFHIKYYADIMALSENAASSVAGLPTSARLPVFPAVILILIGITGFLSGVGGFLSLPNLFSADMLSDISADFDLNALMSWITGNFSLSGLCLAAGRLLFGISNFCFGITIVRYRRCESVNRDL